MATMITSSDVRATVKRWPHFAQADALFDAGQGVRPDALLMANVCVELLDELFEPGGNFKRDEATATRVTRVGGPCAVAAPSNNDANVTLP